MGFNHYLEDEDDKPYFSVNSLSYYYDKLAQYARLIEGFDQQLIKTIRLNEERLKELSTFWDEKMQTFDDGVKDLLAQWVDDGTMDHVVDTTIVEKKIAPINQQLADKVSRNELEAVKSGTPKGVFNTLADLTAAHPNGGTDIYLVSGDANWYYWDGNKWTAGGVYQAAASEFRNMLVNSNVPTSVDAVTGQRLHIRPNGTLSLFAGYSETYQTFKITEGERYYSKFELTEDSTGHLSNVTRMLYPDNTYTQATNLNSNNDGKYTSAILIADRTTLANITVSVKTPGTVTRKNQLLVNLTHLFGKGHEPTIEEFESLLSIFPDSWFDTTNSFENMQKHILRKVVGVPPTQQFTGEDGKAYNYEFKTADGHLVFRYEEAK